MARGTLGIVGVVATLVVGSPAWTGSSPGDPVSSPSSGLGPSSAGQAAGPSTGPAYGSYGWPVTGSVIRPFAPPEGPYGPGHRGIDIAAPAGTPVLAAADGVVAFAGPVAGGRYVSIDHPDGVRTTYSWLTTIVVRAGDVVRRGDPIGGSGLGHPGVDPAHLHLGARYGGTYIDPLLLLEQGSVVGLVRLAPLEEVAPQG
jgi:murein DD-endopeptidase MepM/ murein hydrolase activator NlpD